MALALLILLIEDDNRQNERSCSLLAHLGNFTKDGASKWRALSFSAPLYEKRWRWKLICCLHRTAFWCVKRARLAPPPPSLKPLIWMKSFERGGNLLIHTHLTEKIIVRLLYGFSHLLNQILISLIEVYLKITFAFQELPVNISCMAGLLAFPAFCSVRVYILYFIFLNFVLLISLN